MKAAVEFIALKKALHSLNYSDAQVRALADVYVQAVTDDDRQSAEVTGPSSPDDERKAIMQLIALRSVYPMATSLSHMMGLAVRDVLTARGPKGDRANAFAIIAMVLHEDSAAFDFQALHNAVSRDSAKRWQERARRALLVAEAIERGQEIPKLPTFNDWFEAECNREIMSGDVDDEATRRV